MMASKQLTRFHNSKSQLFPTPNEIYESSKPFGDGLSIYTGSGAGEITQNSYKLAPDKKFPVKEVQIIVESSLSDNLRNKSYEHDTFSELCSSLTTIIQDQVKSIADLHRYKLVTVVYIGENRGQSTRVASRCLWNEIYDNYASASFYGETIFAQATVYGMYFD